MKVCKCGSTRIAPSNLRNRVYRCARCIYRTSGKACRDRYQQTAKHRATQKRYTQTAKGRAKIARTNAKAVKIGDRAIYFKTPEQATAAREMVRARLAAFHQRQHESQQG
jgi:hypothetical protein